MQDIEDTVAFRLRS